MPAILLAWASSDIPVRTNPGNHVIVLVLAALHCRPKRRNSESKTSSAIIWSQTLLVDDKIQSSA
jgi:hypothetical protein